MELISENYYTSLAWYFYILVGCIMFFVEMDIESFKDNEEDRKG